MRDSLAQFLSGAVFFQNVVVALFFTKFWHKTSDRFFGIFSIAFWLMACERLILVFGNLAKEQETYVYLIRLGAFLAIIYAIWQKNLAKDAKDLKDVA